MTAREGRDVRPHRLVAPLLLSAAVVLAAYAVYRLADRSVPAGLKADGDLPPAAAPSALGSPSATTPGARACSAPTSPKVWVRIFSPAPGSAVSSPVLFHLRPVRPAGCDATYVVVVDGIPYQFLGLGGDAPPGPENPEPSRPLPHKDTAFACISGRDFYGELDLRPGPHVLRVLDECPQGSGVPRTVPAAVRFSVEEK